MNEKIKFIWDFRGVDAEEIAKHHSIHLKEYIDKYHLKDSIAATEKINNTYSSAYIISSKDNLILIRDTLKPHRAQNV